MVLEVRFTWARWDWRDWLMGRVHRGKLPNTVSTDSNHPSMTPELQDAILHEVYELTAKFAKPTPREPMAQALCGTQTVSLAILPGVDPKDVEVAVNTAMAMVPPRIRG